MFTKFDNLTFRERANQPGFALNRDISPAGTVSNRDNFSGVLRHNVTVSMLRIETGHNFPFVNVAGVAERTKLFERTHVKNTFTREKKRAQNIPCPLSNNLNLQN